MKQFPADFTWGAATSSYQIEGAYNSDGKGPSIWDAFTTIPGKIKNNDTGQIAGDHYHRFKEDVLLMKQVGITAYRFSFSWPRLMPTGKGTVNQAGIQFYSDLIDALLGADITPWATLYHWDLPLALQLEHDGWLGREIVDYFADFAAVCFEHFGDRIKNWITLNEPWVTAILGHGKGVFAPGRISNREPYLVAHHQILAHAKAVQVYRTRFSHQNGQIGITNNGDWREALTDKPVDIAAAERALEFFLAWFADPVYKGDYPEVMRNRLGDRLPQFSEAEKAMIKGSSDFFGLNHYTTLYAADSDGKVDETSVYGNGGLSEDQDVLLSTSSDWQFTAMKWAVVPWGCRKLLEWIHNRYDGPAIYITENGCAYNDEVKDGQVNDQKRVAFYRQYISACHEAIENGVNLKGYFAWSLMDNFEWAMGYSQRFGMIHVDYQSLQRTLKESAIWYGQVIEQNGVG